MTLGRLLREPLVHFLALAAVIFVAYGLLNHHGLSTKERIEVDSMRVEHLAGLFAKSWQRPPTAEELKGLVDDYVTGEIYYRQAKAMGLDVDDTVVRQRLRMKMELLNDADVDSLTPGDEDLAKYLETHPDEFMIDAEVTFDQVFLDKEKRGDNLLSAAQEILVKLRAGTITDFSTVGDQTLLPSSMSSAPLRSISRQFGDDFSKSLADFPVGTWSGPVTSSFGLHLVKVNSIAAAQVPTLAEVRNDVLREWKADKRKEIQRQRMAEYAKQYDIVINLGEANSAQKTEAKP
jgi:hypothetical protein